MLATLGQSGTSIIDPRQELLALVSSWRALLIADNCEHLIGPVADLVGDLLAAGAGLTLLATSREPLHVGGERVVPVAPLPVADDAVALFMDRASALRPSFGLDGETRGGGAGLPTSRRCAVGHRAGRGSHGGHDAR